MTVGMFAIKSLDRYHDEDGDLCEDESWHPEFGIFWDMEDAEKRLKDLKVCNSIQEIVKELGLGVSKCPLTATSN